MKSLLVLLIMIVSFSALSDVRKITLVNYEIDGTKQWIPGNIAGYEEEELEITLINKAKGPHGFMIPSHDVTEVVKKGEKKTIKVKLKKEGIYPMKCHLHPAHIGGQLIILDK